jgi:hypothetical protein
MTADPEDDTEELADAARWLAERGIEAELSLMADGSLAVDVADEDEAAFLALYAGIARAKRPERIAADGDRAILLGYLQAASPGPAATVEAVKTLIRVVRRMNRERD